MMKKFNASVLKQIVDSSEFKRRLTELSRARMKFKQEKEIVELIHQMLCNQGHESCTEKKVCGYKRDLIVGNCACEFKYHLDCDLFFKLKGELERYVNGKALIDWALNGKTNQFNATPGIAKDTITKKSDIFVWIVVERDLSDLTDSNSLIKCNSICALPSHRTYQKQTMGNYKTIIQPLVAKLLNAINGKRKIKRKLTSEVAVKHDFPSTYRFYILEF